MSNLIGNTRKKGQGAGPTTFKPTRNDPTLLNASPKAWNYNMSRKSSGPCASYPEKTKLDLRPPPAPAQNGKGSNSNKPDWDTRFWKHESLGLSPKEKKATREKASKHELEVSDLFANYPKFVDMKAPKQTEPKKKSHKLSFLTPSPKASSSNLSTPSTEDINPDWSSYHKWWETLMTEPPNGNKVEEPIEVLKEATSLTSACEDATPNVSSLEEISKDEPIQSNENNPKSPPVPALRHRIELEEIGNFGDDTFVMELADLSELVEFLLYKCAAEECLPMLPEVLQDLDNHFRSIVSKYIDQKKAGQVEEPTPSNNEQKPNNTFNIGILQEVSQLHKDLQAKNESIIKTNSCLIAEIENLKAQSEMQEKLVKNYEKTESQLREEIKSLKNGGVGNGDAVTSNQVPVQLPCPITVDLMQLKVENEALKLMNTKLKHEAELNQNILGVMELNFLCQRWRSQGSAQKESPSDEPITGKSKLLTLNFILISGKHASLDIGKESVIEASKSSPKTVGDQIRIN